MKFNKNIIKLANIAPHANVVSFKGHTGYWTKNQLGHNLFISSKNGKIWIPIVLRGQHPDKVSPEAYGILQDHENGNAEYQEWLHELKKSKDIEKIHNGFEFTEKGKQLLNRFKNFLVKNNLDSSMIDKILSQNDVEKIKQHAKGLAKKYRVHSETLRSQENPDVDRIDKEFYNNWAKFNSLFDFDPKSYNPHIDTQEETAVKSLVQNFQDFLRAISPHLDVQMADIENDLQVLQETIKSGKIDASKRAWNLLHHDLVENVKNHYQHIIGKNSELILKLPEYVNLHKELFHGIDN